MKQKTTTQSSTEAKTFKLKVIGVGDAGGNAINRMLDAGINNIEFIAINTDAKALSNIKEPAKTLQIGKKITNGLGVGSNAEIAMQAALENTETIIEILEKADMVFIVAGMGGGTGTGASEVIANHSSSMGILTCALVTMPFEFEGEGKNEEAKQGLKNLKDSVDVLTIFDNNYLFKIEDKTISLLDAFKKIDEYILNSIKAILDIVDTIGQPNVDFADIKTLMRGKRSILIGLGESEGEDKIKEALKNSISNPFGEQYNLKNAEQAIINLSASSMSLSDLSLISNKIKETFSVNTRVKFGFTKSEKMGETIRLTILASVFDGTDERILWPKGIEHALHPKFSHESDTEYEGSYLGPPLSPESPEESPTNTIGYINENNLPSMIADPWTIDDLLDVPSFQRAKITTRDNVPISKNAKKIDDEEKILQEPNKDTIRNDKQTKPKEPVLCTVFSPPKVPPGYEFLIQAFVHYHDKLKEAEQMATEADESTNRSGTKTLTEELQPKTELTFELVIKDVNINDSIQLMKWMGYTESVSFNVEVPKAYSQNALYGKIIISEYSIPIGMINFKIKIEENCPQLLDSNRTEKIGKVKWYQYAFISYASKDWPEVARRLQMLKILNLNYFVDIMHLKAGSKWNKEIYRHIEKCDVFFLFWSLAAKKSKWVKKEIFHAIKMKRGIFENPPAIIPVIIEGPPVPKPPKELNHLHFNDQIIYFVKSP